ISVHFHVIVTDIPNVMNIILTPDRMRLKSKISFSYSYYIYNSICPRLTWIAKPELITNIIDDVVQITSLMYYFPNPTLIPNRRSRLSDGASIMIKIESRILRFEAPMVHQIDITAHRLRISVFTASA